MHELLERPHRLLEQRAELAVDRAGEEAELVETLLHLAHLRAGHAAAERLRRWVVVTRDLGRLDHDRLRSTATVVVGASVDSVVVPSLGAHRRRHRGRRRHRR